jgi:tRNA threonylcarbamoyladenosine modification (KEOPS) complex  Pcc1 subunit
MKIYCNLVIEYESEEKAEKVLRSIKVDDLDFVSSTLEEKKLLTVIKAKSISSLIHTLDDYLACVSVAEKIVE